MMGGCIAHPDQKTVIPLEPEAIIRQDGCTKNDCEKNAIKRFFAHVKRVHPLLKLIILLDGLYADNPTIALIKKYGWHYIIARMEAPAVRIAKTMQTPSGDTITVFDLRFTVPNDALLTERGIHTLEHLFAGFMRDHLNGNGNGVEIIDISPMVCRTGFYMSLIGTPDEQRVANAWQSAMTEAMFPPIVVLLTPYVYRATDVPYKVEI